MVCFLLRRAIRDRLKAKVEDVVANGTNEDVKAAGQEWLDTYAAELQTEQLQINL